MTTTFALICVDCRSPLENKGQLVCTSCKRVFEEKEGVLVCWPKDMSQLSKEEVEYHDHFDEDAQDVHQLNAYRNTFYHGKVTQALKQLLKGSRLLEIGGGTGDDAAPLIDEYQMVLTDISPETALKMKQRFGSKAEQYLAVDAIAIPFEKESFDGVFMVAAFHHLVGNYDKGVAELHRVLKPNGICVLGVEPNAFYFRWIKKVRHHLCHATHTHEHDGSHADAEMEGFTYNEFRSYFPEDQWQDVQIRPMWLFTGFLHYGLEFLFRALKLKKRIVLPLLVEKMIVGLDEVLFKIPGFKHLGWHWIVVGRKKDSNKI